ncbi:TPA: oligosaccharide repeat unit polymerase [Bacillus thuringiensis]|nr:oligosaccharide repeat unit polymerase [Bacillus thuringiensis]
MINPYFMYIVAFVIAIIVYQLGWSYVFPEISVSLLLFLIFTIVSAFFIGFYVYNKKIIEYSNIKFEKKVSLITIFIIGCYLLEFIYEGGFPLLSLLTKSNLIYMEFGIPVFHVFVVTFNSFYATYLFHMLISNRYQAKKILINFLITLSLPLLLVNRGMIMMILISCLFIYLLKIKKKMNFKIVIGLGVVAILVLYIFGLSGNARVNHSYQNDRTMWESDVILRVGGAKEEFINSSIPDAFFWSYIYISSPLANLQHTINAIEVKDLEFVDIFYMVNNEIFPDFINKRINDMYGVTKPPIAQISTELTVATAFAGSYVILGWLGLIIYFITLLFISLVYIMILKRLNSKYFLTGVSIFSSILLFSTFDNMLEFSGLSFQLVYPLLFSVLAKIKR